MSTLDPHLQLEHSYRRLLWLLPPGYRRARGLEVVDVLTERADPGQLRPSRSEMVALLRLSAHTWARHAISPSPVVSRNAMGILAVVLPMMLLFPGAAALHIAGITGSFRMDSLPFGADIPAWLLWCLTAVLIVFAPASWPRYAAALGAVAYLAATVVQYEDNNFLVVGNSVGLLVVQMVAALTLASPGRVARGRKMAPRWCLAALGAVAATLGFRLSTIEYREPFINSPVLLPVTAALAVALGLAALFTAVGRALLPIVAALAGLILAAKYRATEWGNNQSGLSEPWGHFTARDVAVLVAAPVDLHRRADSDRSCRLHFPTELAGAKPSAKLSSPPPRISNREFSALAVPSRSGFLLRRRDHGRYLASSRWSVSSMSRPGAES